MKRCTHCRKVLPFSEFHKNKNRSGGYNGQCKNCRSREEVLVKRRSWYADESAKRKADNYYYVKRYGITIDEKELMIKQQNGCCASCGKEFISKLFTNVDHDHLTNKVREILCRECNLILGYANDSIEILQKIILYLKKHKIPT